MKAFSEGRHDEMKSLMRLFAKEEEIDVLYRNVLLPGAVKGVVTETIKGMVKTEQASAPPPAPETQTASKEPPPASNPPPATDPMSKLLGRSRASTRRWTP